MIFALYLAFLFMIVLALLSFRTLSVRMQRFMALAMVPLTLLMILSPAWAATVAPSATAVNLNLAVIADLINIGVPIVLAIGAAAWKWIDTHSPLQKTQAEDVLHGAYMDLLGKATQYGATQLDASLTRVGSIDVGNAAVAAAANFVMTHGPDLAAKVGVDITTPAGQAKIVQSVTARLGTLLGTAAAQGAPIYKIALPPSVLPSTTT